MMVPLVEGSALPIGAAAGEQVLQAGDRNRLTISMERPMLLIRTQLACDLIVLFLSCFDSLTCGRVIEQQPLIIDRNRGRCTGPCDLQEQVKHRRVPRIPGLRPESGNVDTEIACQLIDRAMVPADQHIFSSVRCRIFENLFGER